MNLTEYLNNRLKKHKILLMTHAVVGYPSLEENWKMLEAMGEADVDLVELQMPFSEPSADGTSFCKSKSGCIKKWCSLERLFRFDEECKRTI